MKEMTKMVCRESANSQYSLTIGKIYNIVDHGENYVRLVNDKNNLAKLCSSRFRNLTEEEKIMDMKLEIQAKLEAEKATQTLFLEAFIRHHPTVAKAIRNNNASIIILQNGIKGIAMKGENELFEHFVYAINMAYHRAMVEYYKNAIIEAGIKETLKARIESEEV